METGAVGIQVCMCLAMMSSSPKIQTDEDGNAKNESENEVGVWIVTIIQYMGLLLLYGGTITVITSIVLVTPGTVTRGPKIFSEGTLEPPV